MSEGSPPFLARGGDGKLAYGALPFSDPLLLDSLCLQTVPTLRDSGSTGKTPKHELTRSPL